MSRRIATPNRFDAVSRDWLDGTAEAAFVSDQKRRIVAWNQSATALLGFEAGQVLGRRCYRVVRATDLSGNRFCSETCPLRQMLRRREAIHAFPIRVPSASGATPTVRCTVFVLPGSEPGGAALLHVLLPASEEHGDDRKSGAPLDSAQSAAGSDPDPEAPVSSGCLRALSPREAEILRLMATGLDAAQIAVLLSISPVTVRNHIQHILAKLEVHDRLNAVVVAHRRGLI